MKQQLNSKLFFSRTHDFLEVYIPSQRDGSDKTKSSYRDALSIFRRYVSDQLNISISRFKFSDCTYDLILAYRNWLLDDKKYKESTVNQRLAAIKAYMHYAAIEDITLQQIDLSISAVPAVRVPKEMKPIIESNESLAFLLNKPKNTHLGRRDMTLMSLLFDTAIRVRELVNLKLNDVDVNSDVPHIVVMGKGEKQRLVGLSDKTVKLVKSYLNEFHGDSSKTDYFFYTVIDGVRKQMSVRNVQRLIKKYADETREAGYELPDSVSPHTFRRTRGTKWRQAGINLFEIAETLGHASVQTTIDHYAASSLEQKRAAMSKNQDVLADEKQEWPEDEEELAKICGLR